MTREAVDRLVAGYEAWNRRDFDGALSLMSPEIEWSFHGGTQLPGTDAAFRGHEGVRRFWREFLDAWEWFTIEVEDSREKDERILLFGRFRGTGAGSGVEVDAPFVHMWEFADELATRFEAFADRDEALRAAGLSE